MNRLDLLENCENMGENTTNIKNLMQNVLTIKNKYDDIAVITGENFNIFSVLKMDSREVRMHSAFIGELLNPKGSHGLKTIPLKIFVRLLEAKFSKNDDNDVSNNKFILDVESVTAVIEKSIGTTNEDKTEGGRIDIIVEDKNKNAIIIENKIYAIEQTNQLVRYNNYLKNAPILYLTLNESNPTSHGELKENVDYFKISYKEDIKEWLKLCLKESAEFPMLREVIKQYLYLIKKLTNQTINEKMSEEIIKLIISNQDSLQASKLICDNYQNAVNKLISYEVIQFQEFLIANGFEKEDVSIERAGQAGHLFLVLKTFELDINETFDLGIIFEFNSKNKCYLFCVIERNHARNGKINLNPKFTKIKDFLHGRIAGLSSYEWAIGYSKEHTLELDSEFYLHEADNFSVYTELVEKLKHYRHILSSTNN